MTTPATPDHSLGVVPDEASRRALVVDGRPRRAAVLGHPVAHSLSPVMHRAAYAALGLAGWSYQALDVEETEVVDLLGRLDPEWAGLSVTMPLKRAVQPALTACSELAARVGAVNTVVVEPVRRSRLVRQHGDGPVRQHGDGPVRLHGYNTDVYGIVRALGEAGASRVTRAVVLGGGATAASALAALLDLGCPDPVVLVRSAERAAPLLAAAARLGVRPELGALDGATVTARVAALGADGALVSTLPGSAADPFVPAAVAGVARGGGVPALLDVRYDPWPTPLATGWSAAGGLVASGLDMLAHQAEGQVRLMTGLHPPLGVMRAAGRAELERRAGERRSPD